MERFTRLLGIGLLVALAALSVGKYQQTLESATNDSLPKATSLPDTGPLDDGVGEEPGGEQVDEAAGDTEAAPPEYLSFAGGIRSGLYNVADLPSSNDRDFTERTNASDSDQDDETGGTVEIEGELVPGIYATAFGVEDCSFELRRIMKTRSEAVIGQDRLDKGRMLVTINEIEPDSFLATPGCGDWSRWSPLVKPLTVTGDGDYWIGDLKAGNWDVPVGCMWEKVVGFRGALLWDVQDSGFGPEPLVIDDETIGVRIRGCGSNLAHESAT